MDLSEAIIKENASKPRQRQLTNGLLLSRIVLAMPINKIYLLCGSAGKVFKFDGRQQAVTVVRHAIDILIICKPTNKINSHNLSQNRS